MLNKISILGVKKIILILVFGFILFWWNVFAETTYEVNDWKSWLWSANNDSEYQKFRAEQISEANKQSNNYTEKDVDGNTLDYNSEGVLIKWTDSEWNVFYENKIDWNTNWELNTKVDTSLTDSYTKWQLDWISTNKSDSTSSSSSEWIQVHVTEKIPGADCDWSDWDYTCTVQPGFKTVMQLMWWIIKYFTYLSALWWVLFIVINGLMLSMWSMGWNKDEIKKKITMTIGGLILLLLSGLILNAIAPWIYK